MRYFWGDFQTQNLVVNISYIFCALDVLDGNSDPLSTGGTSGTDDGSSDNDNGGKKKKKKGNQGGYKGDKGGQNNWT